MRKFWIILATIAVIIIALHLILEPLVLRYVNKTLNELKGYRGHVEDIDIHLYRGAYQIDSIFIVKTDSVSGAEEPFFSASVIDLSVEWNALFDGAIVGEITVRDPIINFTVQPGGQVQDGGGNDWVQTIKNLIPIRINRFEIVNGNVYYKDPTSSPKVNIGVHDLHALARNMDNVVNENERLPSTIELSANTIGKGKLTSHMDMNVLKETPDFDFALEVEQVNLTALSDFTKAYAGFTFKKGAMYISSEVAMKDGQYEGYVKPLLRDVGVIDLDNENISFWRKVWEVIIGTVLEIFENQRKDQFATQIPFSGSVSQSDVGILPTIGNILKNAFIKAFQENIEQSVSLESVGGKKEKKGLFDFLKSDDKKKE